MHGEYVDHTRMCSPYFAIDSGQIGRCKCYSVLIYSEQYRQVYFHLTFTMLNETNNAKDYPSSTIKYYDML